MQKGGYVFLDITGVTTGEVNVDFNKRLKTIYGLNKPIIITGINTPVSASLIESSGVYTLSFILASTLNVFEVDVDGELTITEQELITE